MSGVAEFVRLVVVGSSAGGIEALSELVSTLPDDFPAPMVIAQHLDPARPSHLVEILGRHTSLPVRFVTNTATLEPGVILVVPSNEQVAITDHQIRLTGDGHDRPAPSIDRLFSSAASAYGVELIAVILTGTGSDGAAGARLVKQAGGTVVIENPETAEYPSMPQSLAPVLVDFTTDLREIGPLLHQLLTEEGVRIDHSEAGEGMELEQFLQQVRDECKIDFSQYKPPTILRRLQRRMVATNSRNLKQYRAYLEHDRDEYQNLINSFLIKVTEFFRDPEFFDHLRTDVLPALIEQSREQGGNKLRIWSAGCSTGEEAYSLAILVAQLLGDELNQFNVRIFATDINADVVTFARRGLYSYTSVKELPDDVVADYFTPSGGDYEVNKIIRSMVVFGQHDLAQRSPFPSIDLVLSRNVLIYFTAELRSRALHLFAYSLRDGGYLALGKSESPSPLNEYFAVAEQRLKIYRRQGGAAPIPLGPVDTSVLAMHQVQPSSRRNQQTVSAGRWSGAGNARDDSLDSRFHSLLFNLPVGVVMVDHNYDIRMINNLARQMLGIHGAAVGEDLLHVIRTMPLETLRDSIDQAFQKTEPVTVSGEWSVETVEGEQLYIEIICQRQAMEANGNSGHAVVIALTNITETVVEQRRVADVREREHHENQQLSDRVAQLTRSNRQLVAANQELAEVNESMRITSQELMVSNEESHATAEEIETLNEELQTTNEELETLNEEMQATVEELNATNEDLQARTIELQEMTVSLEEQHETSETQRSRLEAVLWSMTDAVVVVDRIGEITPMNSERCIQMFGQDLAKLIPEDENGDRLDNSQDPVSRAAGQESFVMQFTVNFADSGRRWFEANAQPIQGDGEAGGSVLVIRDITDSSLRRLQDEFMSVASHELKTPLTALRGYLDMLNIQLPEEDERAHHRINIALQMVDRLVRLVNDLLDVGRLQSGKLDLSRETVDIGTLVQQTIDMGQSMSSDHKIEVEIPDESISVDADPMRIQQVLLNLLTNAINYSPDADQILVRVRKAEGNCILEVQDFGMGIPHKAQSQVFTRFFQSTKSTGQFQRGLGLGLFISKEIVDAHGGWIDLDSTPGEGTTFRVALPLSSS